MEKPHNTQQEDREQEHTPDGRPAAPALAKRGVVERSVPARTALPVPLRLMNTILRRNKPAFIYSRLTVFTLGDTFVYWLVNLAVNDISNPSIHSIAALIRDAFGAASISVLGFTILGSLIIEAIHTLTSEWSQKDDNGEDGK